MENELKKEKKSNLWDEKFLIGKFSWMNLENSDSGEERCLAN